MAGKKFSSFSLMTSDPVAEARSLLHRIRALGAVEVGKPETWHALEPEDRTALTGACNASDAERIVSQQTGALQQRISQLRAQFGDQMKKAWQVPTEVLNEEGLPFVDPLETLPDSPPQSPHRLSDPPPPTGNVLGRVPGRIVPFDPTLHGDDRRAWMNSIMDQLEEEEQAEEAQHAPAPLSLRRGFLQRESRPKKQAPPAEPERPVNVPPGMDPEDAGTYEEAARIVELLGPQVIQGHPNAERIFAEMEASQPHIVQKTEPAPAPSAKPPIGDVVVERAADAPTERTSSSTRRPSAFKQRMRKDTLPSAPSVSQGVSAIERAGRADDEMAEQRRQQGLPPRVPHARPTKAYAAKLAHKAESTEMDVDEKPNRRVRFGGEEVYPPEEPEEHEEEEEEDGDSDGAPWTSEDDMIWDSDEAYDSDDLEALKPSMDGHPDDAFWTEELAREYAEAKARLSLPVSRSTHDQVDDTEDTYGLAPLSSQPRVSRFKAARMSGESVPDPNGQVAEMSANERTMPMMVLPSLAPVRFPRPLAEDDRDLEGESDEDDERLHALMRARMSMQAAEEPSRAPQRPPQVGRA